MANNNYLNKIKVLDASGKVSLGEEFGFGIGSLRVDESNGNIVYDGFDEEGNIQPKIFLKKEEKNGKEGYTLDETVLKEYIDDRDSFLKEVEYDEGTGELILSFQIGSGDENEIKDLTIDLSKILSLHTYTEVESMEDLPDTTTAKEGDIAIVKSNIGESSLTAKTAYVYDGKNWMALDGNYNAENVYLSTNLIMTANIGAQELSQGQSNKTLATEGKNIKQVLSMLLAEEKAPSIKSNPTVTTKIGNNTTPANNDISVEGGSTIIPSWSVNLSAGSYTYGPPTGITAESWEVTDNRKNINSEWENKTSKSSSGIFDRLVLPAGESYKITAKATYDAAPLAWTNLGEEYKAGNALFDATTGAKSVQITGGSQSDVSPSITAWQQGYYIGTLESKDTIVTSDILRGVDTDKVLKNRYVKDSDYTPKTLTFRSLKEGEEEKDRTGPPFTGTMAKFVVAYPSNFDSEDRTKGLTKFFNNSAFEEYVSNFSKGTVKVAGADNNIESNHAIDYTVCTWTPTSAFSGPIEFEITLS